MIAKSFFAVAASAAAMLAANADGTKRPMTLVVMVDGLRADAVETGEMPNFERLRAGKWQPGYKSAWSVTGEITPGSAPSSAPNHVSIATGYTPAQHGVTDNSKLEGGTASLKPTWLKRIMDAKDGATALFVYSWSPDGNLAPTEGVEYMGGTDAENAVALPSRLASAAAPDATLYFIDAVDAAGHAGYYYPMSAGYRAAVAMVDGYIGACMNAIASRPTFADEDWLIAVTSDHGGYSNQHGTITAGRHAHTIPIVISGTGVTQGRITGSPYNFDVAASALAHFGVAVDDLQATLRDGTAAPAGRTLNDGLAVYLPFSESTTANAAAGSSVVPEEGGSPALIANGMVGKALNIPSGAYLKLTGTDTASLAYEDSNRSFTAVVWAKYDLAKQTASANVNDDPVLFGNKGWTGKDKGMIFAARMRKQLGSTYYAGAGVNLGSGVNNQTQGSGRLDFYPFDVESASLWTFYAITRNDDGVITVYQGRSDGTLGWACGTFDGFTLESGCPFFIGQDGNGNYSKKFVGAVDDFALWTRGLSHDDIRRIYENGRAGMELGDLLKMDANDAPTMDVESSGAGVYTLTFGGRRTVAHSLYIAYGADDAGMSKYNWSSFVKVADVPVDMASYEYTVPDEMKSTNSRFRFFLMQTENLPYAKEVEYVHSDGGGYFDSGIAPRRDLITEFDARLTANNGAYQNFFGAFTLDGNKLSNYGLCRYYNPGNGNHDKWDREYNTGKGYQFTGQCTLDVDYHVVFSATNLIVNGEAQNSGITLSQFVEGGKPTVNVFRNEKLKSDGSFVTYDQTINGYFKNFSLYTPKRRVRDYVPAVDAGGTVGMFDAVTGQFQTSVGTAFAAGTDCDPGRTGWVRCVSDVYLASDVLPVAADYIGQGADPLDFADAANWRCFNTYGVELDNAVPNADTAVTVAGETVFAVPAGTTPPVCASVKFANAMLADGADLRGLNLAKVTSDSVIDLRGRTLFLADGTGAGLGAFAVTDTSDGEPGTLRIEVPDGATLVNSSVALTGNLKLRKEGAGVFSAAKASQTYSGGTDVIAGWVRVGSAGSSHFGTGDVLIPEGTTYDAYGNADAAVSLVLAGGKITSIGEYATLPSTLTMTADSTLEFAVLPANHDMALPSGAVWNLGGKTLSVVMDGYDPDWNVREVTISNGTINVSVNTYNGNTKGYMQIGKLNGRDGLKLDLGISYMRIANGVNGNSTVFDLTANTPDESNAVWSYSNYRMQIFGTFTPQTVRGFNMTMMDGSTLNLANWSGAFDCTFTNPKYSNNTAGTLCNLQFNANSTVMVNLKGRDLWAIANSESPYIVTWKTRPDDTVSFTLDEAAAKKGFTTEVCDEGLKLVAPQGFSIFLR